MRGLADPGEDMGSLSGGVRGFLGAGVGGKHESCVKQEGSARHGVGSGRSRQRERLLREEAARRCVAPTGMKTLERRGAMLWGPECPPEEFIRLSPHLLTREARVRRRTPGGA